METGLYKIISMSFVRLIMVILSGVLLTSVQLQAAPRVETSSRTATAASKPVPRVNLNAMVLKAVASMPRGGGYSTSREALERMCTEAVSWNARAENLRLNPRKATPSFCSEAAYFVFLLTLQHWEKAIGMRLPGNVWQYLAPRFPQPDGCGAWGRMNANGPGMAKWARDLGFGVNFTDVSKAFPGDFLKIFWTDEIGSREFGHFVVFLGLERDKAGKPTLRFWSSNQGMGYGVKSVSLDSCKRLLFTRLTNPAALVKYNRLPETDEWLASLLQKRVSVKEMNRMCNLPEKGSR